MAPKALLRPRRRMPMTALAVVEEGDDSIVIVVIVMFAAR